VVHSCHGGRDVRPRQDWNERRARGPIRALLVEDEGPLLRLGRRVLYVSGYTDDVVVRNGVPPAGSAFLQKPFAPSAFLQTVREVLDSDRARGDGRGSGVSRRRS
jgi:hypothetical protein